MSGVICGLQSAKNVKVIQMSWRCIKEFHHLFHIMALEEPTVTKKWKKWNALKKNEMLKKMKCIEWTVMWGILLFMYIYIYIYNMKPKGHPKISHENQVLTWSELLYGICQLHCLRRPMPSHQENYNTKVCQVLFHNSWLGFQITGRWRLYKTVSPTQNVSIFSDW